MSDVQAGISPGRALLISNEKVRVLSVTLEPSIVAKLILHFIVRTGIPPGNDGPHPYQKNFDFQ